MLAEGDEQAVDWYPVALGKVLLQGQHRLLRGRGLHIPPAVGYPVDMDVNADHRFGAGDPKREMGALGPDPSERLQHLIVAWEIAAELVNRAHRDGMDLIRLPLVECRRSDEDVDLIRRERDDVLRGGSGLEESNTDR